MIQLLHASPVLSSCLLAAVGAVRLWYAVPLITSVSLVCAATRHEEMNAILAHAARFALWIVVFMAIVLGVIQLLSWLQ
ncbi:MAG TPA: hypothetical protein VHU84_02505 [Lacipirellulaceae bacterium]|jgi:hypothetical protein|nr:hypothetical protein [Lacipirellulaceae bacterium]